MELTGEQKSLTLDTLGLAKAYVANDRDSFDSLMKVFAENGELPSVVAILTGHYVASCIAIGERDGLGPAEVIERTYRNIVNRAG